MKNILVLHTDAQMQHWLGASGNNEVRTPHLDRLAAQGSLFRNAFACSGVCVPSRASLMSGRYPEGTGVVSNERVLPPWERTMGEYFRQAGYKTGYFGKAHYGRNFDAVSNEFDLFFEKKHYNRYLKEAGVSVSYPEKKVADRRARYWNIGRSAIPEEHYFEKVIADRSIDFMRDTEEAPFLAFVSFVAPHGPFTPPGKYADLYDPASITLAPRSEAELKGKPQPFVRWVRQNQEYLDEEELRRFLAIQYGLVTYVDEQVGRILAALKDQGRAEDTLVIFASDHGDFGTGYGIIGKSWNMIDPLLHIPLIARLPGITHGKIEEAFVENVDILPTLLEYAGIPVPPFVQGHSFLPLLRGGDYAPKEACFAFNSFEDSETKLSQSAIRKGPWRLIVSETGEDQLYHSETDPWNWHNLAGLPEHRETVAELRDFLLRHQIQVCGSSFDKTTARFWEDETCFYDKTRFTGARINRRGDSEIN